MPRMRSSSPEMRRGVNARDTRPRSFVWSGGSRKIIIRCGAFSGPRLSSTVVWAELKVAVSRLAASTSAKRLRAKKPYSSLKYTGASSRRRFQAGYGSSSMTMS